MKNNWKNLKASPVWYKNCIRQRLNEAKICQDCPFRSMIEEQERKDREKFEKIWRNK